jgi:cytidylate kinase
MSPKESPAEHHIVVAFSRQLGAGGAIVGQRLAKRLGFAYLDREILQQAAKQCGCTEGELLPFEERVSRFWESLMNAFAAGPPEGIFTSAPDLRGVRDQQLFNIEARAIRDLVARQNAVVIGRGAFHVLREQPGLVSVFLHAPAAARVPQVMAAMKLKTEEEARRMIEQVDKDRSQFLREMTGREMTDARNYDLSINTARIPLEAAEDQIVAIVERRQRELAAVEPEANSTAQ